MILIFLFKIQNIGANKSVDKEGIMLNHYLAVIPSVQIAHELPRHSFPKIHIDITFHVFNNFS